MENNRGVVVLAMKKTNKEEWEDFQSIAETVAVCIML